ncbi:hypothetical protein F3Y22_tig00110729pilonHSYRG00172 [Hibiscus syriacus]|uniref:Uncharacterized protein n=1 Tax=Hibiscus syriacus TaxID=106335 RepID=A0A6A2ZTL8_HIBSY|nr:hypothetical protein F3Y22_tig00110729pilonHSYRG00172 [Hibiscus syriacus]
MARLGWQLVGGSNGIWIVNGGGAELFKSWASGLGRLFGSAVGICWLFTWGRNQRGTLGHPPETKTENIPSQVKVLANVKIVQAAIGGWHCLAVDDEGRAYAWGGNEYGQCGEEPKRKDDTGRPLRRDIVHQSL